MVEIHAVTSDNRHLYVDIMHSYFEIRHDIFVGERQWMSLESPDGLEIDQYDNEHAIYILAIDDGEVVGGQRLYPTLLPHMITQSFPHLIDGTLPSGEDVYEWTRFFIVPKRRGTAVDGMLMAAVQQYCLENQVATLTAVGEMWWLPRWHRYGFVVRPLGLPQDIEGQPTIAVQVEVSERTFAHALRVGQLEPKPLKFCPGTRSSRKVVRHAA